MAMAATVRTSPTTRVVLPARLDWLTQVSYWQFGRLKSLTMGLACVKKVRTSRAYGLPATAARAIQLQNPESVNSYEFVMVAKFPLNATV
jgi:hypothetical protein